MTVRQMFELMTHLVEAYRPMLPVRAAKEFLTALGDPRDGMLGGGQWVTLAYFSVLVAALLAVSHLVGPADRRAIAGTGPS